jgi:hypothetical protein
MLQTQACPVPSTTLSLHSPVEKMDLDPERIAFDSALGVTGRCSCPRTGRKRNQQFDSF